jgi:uncharacterized protein DUF4180
MDVDACELHGQRVMQLRMTGDQLRNDREAIEIIFEAAAHNAELIVIPVERLSEDFFDLKSRVAGEVLQEFVTYRKRVVIAGDISKQLSGSSALRDFVYECNAGHEIWFVRSLDELGQKLLAQAGQS